LNQIKVEPADQIRTDSFNEDSIDFNKLSLIVRKNWHWMLLIFLSINAFAYLFIRYTKNVYESASEIKLDINDEASEIGIKNVMEDKYVNIVSGEIEIIRSELFLNQVLNDSAYEITFVSVGRVLNEELFGNPPAFVKVPNKSHSVYNQPISFSELNENEFRLKLESTGETVRGKYGALVSLRNIDLVLTRNNLFRKGDEVGYYFIVNSRESLLQYLLTNLLAEPLNYNANTIRVSFKDHNPYKAQAVLSKIDTLYLRYSNEQKNLANRQKIEWLSKELTQIEKRMEGFENYFENFTIENRTNDLDENLKTTVAAINQLDSERFVLSRRLIELKSFRNGIKNQQYTPGVYLRSALPPSLMTQVDALLQLQIELEKMRLSYNEITFSYQQKKKESDIILSKITDMLAEVEKSWTDHARTLEKRKATLEEEFSNYPEKNTQFSKNERFYKLYEELYLTLMESKSQFEIAQAGTTPDFKILSPASLSLRPISPNRPMILGIGLVASIVLNLFFLGILYLANNKITSLGDLERSKSTTVIGSIPANRYSEEKGIHIIDHPNSMVSEAIRSLRTNLDFFNTGVDQKTIAISSTVSGEGKSFIALNLGGVLALSNKRVVLVDLDMRKLKSYDPFEIKDPSKGVSTLLIRKHNWKDCIVKTALPNFDFIPAGPHPPNPSELMVNGEFSSFLQQLKDSYDYVIMDTPPVGLVTDGIMAMRRADISIYVFRANYSKREFIKTLQRINSLNKFSHITTLLNALPVSAKTYGYGYYEENRRKNSLRSLLKV
jgi:tyrosine-protein kinase Etk/Wzc